MKFTVITVFPEMIEAYLSGGVVGRACEKKHIEVKTINPRKFTADAHHTVDDRPYGGGDGMVMLSAPLAAAVQEAVGKEDRKPYVVYLSPSGGTWTGEKAQSWAEKKHDTVLISGRYGGVDQRFINQFCDEQISVGDYVLSGGELPALSIIDSVARFVPGVLGNIESSERDSFSDGLLEAPQFTRPREFGGEAVPEFLLSGDHARIKEMRKAVSIALTGLQRPDICIDKGLHNWALKKIDQLSDRDLIVLGLRELLATRVD